MYVQHTFRSFIIHRSSFDFQSDDFLVFLTVLLGAAIPPEMISEFTPIQKTTTAEKSE